MKVRVCLKKCQLRLSDILSSDVFQSKTGRQNVDENPLNPFDQVRLRFNIARIDSSLILLLIGEWIVSTVVMRCARSGRQDGSLLARWSFCEQKEKTGDIRWKPIFYESCQHILEKNHESQGKPQYLTVTD
jgi:hypothetical protein